jgi:hypothetical protein
MAGVIAAADFDGREGEIFTIVDGDVRLDVELMEYTPHPGGASIVFRGPSEPVLSQGIYTFEHAFLDVFDLFIVPIGPDDTGMRYEAVFN